jgi:hypothetical protein
MIKTNYIEKVISIVIILVLLAIFIPMNIAEASGKLELNKTNVTICVEQTAKLKVTNNSSEVTWTSSDKKIATVSKSGKVKGIKSGKVTITAKVGKKSVKCKVTVRKHSWYTVEETGHFERVKTGTQRIIYCNCGEVFYSGADRRAHDPENDHGYSVWDEPAYETKWVVDTKEYKICKYCKKTKS